MSLQYPLECKVDREQTPGVAHWEGNVITCSPQDVPTMEVIMHEFYFHHLELKKAEENQAKISRSTGDEYSIIPELTMQTMKAYVEYHQPTGSFLQAVFSNDLKSAVGIADDKNFPAMRKIMTWVVCVAPYECQGSPEKYKEWIKEFNPGGGN